jgi:CRISPR type III-A-associated RAMP protein Csm4
MELASFETAGSARPGESGNLSRPGILVKLRPSRPWRIGPASGEPDRVDLIYHSDTLFSAVTHAMRLLGRMEYWLEVTARRNEPGEGAPLVRFTSMFPFFGDTLYVPPPRHIWPPAPSVRVHYAGARFIPVSLVESIFAGKPLQDDRWSVDGASACLVPTGKSGPFRIGVRSSAAVDRLSGASQPHRTTCLEFVPKAGLWFAVAFADAITRDQWSDPIRAAIRLLADSGFGGERSRGWGRTHAPEFRDGPLSRLIYRGTSVGEFLHWNLSLLSPADSDRVEWDRGSYSTTVRGGRIESPAGSGAAKKLLTLVEEGSVLSATVLEGNAPDVAPEGFAHPVYHAGWAFVIPVPSEVPKQIDVVEPPVTEAAEEIPPSEAVTAEAADEAREETSRLTDHLSEREGGETLASAGEDETAEEAAHEEIAEEQATDEFPPPDAVEEAVGESSHFTDDDVDDVVDSLAVTENELREIPTSEEELERLEGQDTESLEDEAEPPVDDPGPMEAPFREPDDLTPIEPDPGSVETPQPGESPNPDETPNASVETPSEPEKPEEPVE